MAICVYPLMILVLKYKIVFSFFSPQESPQRKKRKSEAIGTSNQIDLLALGTAVGSILLYSTVKGELHSKLIVSIDMCICVGIYIKDDGETIRDLLKTKQFRIMQ